MKIQELKHEIGGRICAMQSDDDYIPDLEYVAKLERAMDFLQKAEDEMTPMRIKVLTNT